MLDNYGLGTIKTGETVVASKQKVWMTLDYNPITKIGRQGILEFPEDDIIEVMQFILFKKEYDMTLDNGTTYRILITGMPELSAWKQVEFHLQPN